MAALSVNVRPVALHGEQQAPARRCPHRQKLRAKRRFQPPQQRQRLCCREPLQLSWKLGKAAPLHRQNRGAGAVPQAAAGIPQRREGRGLSQKHHRDRQPFTPEAVGRCRPEQHRQHKVHPRRRHQQRSAVHIRIEHTPGIGDVLSCQQSQRQNASRQRAGDGEGQQCQPPEMPLPAEGRQRQQHPRRRLHRRGGQKRASR